MIKRFLNWLKTLFMRVPHSEHADDITRYEDAAKQKPEKKNE